MSSDFAIFFAFSKYYVQKNNLTRFVRLFSYTIGQKILQNACFCPLLPKCTFLQKAIFFSYVAEIKLFKKIRKRIAQKLQKIYTILKYNICFGTSKQSLRTRVRPKLFATQKILRLVGKAHHATYVDRKRRQGV